VDGGGGETNSKVLRATVNLGRGLLRGEGDSGDGGCGDFIKPH